MKTAEEQIQELKEKLEKVQAFADELPVFKSTILEKGWTSDMKNLDFGIQ